MLSLAIEVVQIFANSGFRFSHVIVGMQEDLFVLEASPKLLDKDVVDAAAAPVHADGDARLS